MTRVILESINIDDGVEDHGHEDDIWWVRWIREDHCEDGGVKDDGYEGDGD